MWYPLFHVMLSPMFASAAMSMSSVCVVSNALRLRLFKPRFSPSASPDTPAAPCGCAGEISTKGVFSMTKKLTIEGMMRSYCTGRVEKALSALEGVSAVMDLEGQVPPPSPSPTLSDAALTQAVADAGYEVTAIQ